MLCHLFVVGFFLTLLIVYGTETCAEIAEGEHVIYMYLLRQDARKVVSTGYDFSDHVDSGCMTFDSSFRSLHFDLFSALCNGIRTYVMFLDICAPYQEALMSKFVIRGPSISSVSFSSFPVVKEHAGSAPLDVR
jgi:hypothetical protein